MNESQKYLSVSKAQQERILDEQLKECDRLIYESNMILAKRYLDSGEFDDAIRAYEKCLKYFPNDLAAKGGLFWLRKKLELADTKIRLPMLQNQSSVAQNWKVFRNTDPKCGNVDT